MKPKLGILVIHGMGSQKDSNFAQPMIDQVNHRVQKLGFDPGNLRWQPVYWADILQQDEVALWTALSHKHNLSFKSVRQFVLYNLADAIAYQREPGLSPDVYHLIHTRVHERILDLRKQLGDEDAPLMIMAHSLGSYIISNYIWDQQQQNSDAIGSTEFEKMRTLCALVTFGCNIAIFSLALRPYVGIDFPAKELKPPLKGAARWLNYLDPQDVLAYPVKPLCKDYSNNPQILDKEINVGNLFTSWNPLAHDQYWTDNDFTSPVAEQIAALLRIV